MPHWNEEETFFMLRAIELAERGKGWVEPNPMVGCVLVRDGVVVGEGWHSRFGDMHAEVSALQAAGSAARGATAYVSLEPCCHYGKTPPCTKALIEAGILRVVAAVRDPFENVQGKGLEQLQQAGLQVEHGLCAEAAAQILLPYLTRIEKKRPFVIAKWAMSLDGRIATASGQSQWISGPHSRAIVHALRAQMDAIMVGIETALADDPLLTARPSGSRVAERVILDSQARLPVHSQLARSAQQAPVTLVVGPQADQERTEALQALGCQIHRGTSLDPCIRLADFLQEAARRGVTNLLCEGGGKVLGALHDMQAIDEVHVFVAPLLLGGNNAAGPLQGQGVHALTQALRLVNTVVQQVGEDMYIQGRLR